MSQEYDLTLKISRYDPDSRRSWIQDYRLKAGRILRFVDLFQKINDEQDPSLAWNSSCEHGQCGTCGMKVNGKPLLTSELLIENAVKHFKTQSFTVEPLTIASTRPFSFLNTPTFSRYLESQGKERYAEIRDALRVLMTEKVGVFRNEKGLVEAIEELKQLKERTARMRLSSKSLVMNQEPLQFWELDHLLDVSMVIASCALARKESRGAHYREDYPARSPEFQYHTLAYMTDYGKVTLGRRSVDMSIFEARGEQYERFGIIERKY